MRGSQGVSLFFSVLLTVETTLIERADVTVAQRSPAIEIALQEKVFDTLDNAIKTSLESVTVQDLLDCSDMQRFEQAYMLNM